MWREQEGGRGSGRQGPPFLAEEPGKAQSPRSHVEKPSRMGVAKFRFLLGSPQHPVGWVQAAWAHSGQCLGRVSCATTPSHLAGLVSRPVPLSPSPLQLHPSRSCLLCALNLDQRG